jgi:hypothetical protein
MYTSKLFDPVVKGLQQWYYFTYNGKTCLRFVLSNFVGFEYNQLNGQCDYKS